MVCALGPNLYQNAGLKKVLGPTDGLKNVGIRLVNMLGPNLGKKCWFEEFVKKRDRV